MYRKSSPLFAAVNQRAGLYILQRPNIDGSSARLWTPSSTADRLVEILGNDQEVASEVLARLHEQAVGHESFPIRAHGRGEDDIGDLFPFPVTDFQTIAAVVLEKDGVVAGLLVDRCFDIPHARLECDRRQPIDLADTVGPEREPAFVRDVLRSVSEYRLLPLPDTVSYRTTATLRNTSA